MFRTATAGGGEADVVTINPSGTLSVPRFGSAGTATVCRNSASELAFCSSSLRYKTNVATFIGGMNIINRLRPIAFNWKQDGVKDIGFGAEEVEKVAPHDIRFTPAGRRSAKHDACAGGCSTA